jgi:putative membrane protein
VELLLFFLLGLILGTLSAFIPGMHSNTVIAIVASFGFADERMAVLTVGIFSSHMVATFIPSIFFGIPADETGISVLPGQRLVKEGKGLETLKTVLASLCLSALVCIALFPITLWAFPIVYGALKPYIGWLLLAFSAIFILRSSNRVPTLCIFLLSGILGMTTLKIQMYDVFLPLFSGFFALSSILTYEKSAKIPKQKDLNITLAFIPFVLVGIGLGFFADLLPGVGAPSQIAALATVFMPMNSLGYMATISSISMSESIFSFSTSASLEKSRMGATEWLDSFADLSKRTNLTQALVLFLLGLALTSAFIYAIRGWAGKLAGMDFGLLNKAVLFYIILVIYVLDGWLGLAILTVSTALGVLAVKSNASRGALMGAIIVPTLMLLFRIFL